HAGRPAWRHRPGLGDRGAERLAPRHHRDGAGRAGHAAGLRLRDLGPAVRPHRREHPRPDGAVGPPGRWPVGAPGRAGGRGRPARSRERVPDPDRPDLRGPLHERPPQPRVSLLRDPEGDGAMTLPVPTLDDRRFQDIVDEAKRLIPRSCPEWTDHNLSDPGITLIELFVWTTEMVLYCV